MSNSNKIYSDLAEHLPFLNEALEPYLVLNMIGKGTFGMVFKAIKKDTQEKVAIKIV